MEALFGSLLRGLGQALAFLYDVIPSYGIAILLLTLLVRVALLPLTIKQTRSMQEMGKLQPKLKEIQRKHKGDRQKVSEETMKLYKEHKVNPLGGCLPLLLQLPIFFALFSVLRAATPEIAILAEPPRFGAVEDAFCHPAGEATGVGFVSNTIECDADGDDEFELSFEVERWQERDGDELIPRNVLTRCDPLQGDGGVRFSCQTPVGTGHLPERSDLFASVIDGGETFLGMHLSCGATQAQSESEIRKCAPLGTQAGGPPLIGYYGLIAFMVVSTWYQTRQMQQTSGQAQQMQMMGRIMPVFLGFISLSIPAGVLVYWVTTNAWQIGQQTVMLKKREAAEAAAAPKGKPKKALPNQPKGDGVKVERPPQRKGRSARSRKKRRKR